MMALFPARLDLAGTQVVAPDLDDLTTVTQAAPHQSFLLALAVARVPGAAGHDQIAVAAVYHVECGFHGKYYGAYCIATPTNSAATCGTIALP